MPIQTYIIIYCTMYICIPAEANDRMHGCAIQEVGLVLDSCQSHCLLRSTRYIPLNYTDPVLCVGLIVCVCVCVCVGVRVWVRVCRICLVYYITYHYDKNMQHTCTTYTGNITLTLFSALLLASTVCMCKFMCVP